MIDFHEHLRRQLNFIKASCYAYDSGELGEGVRIATAVRVLFHDTANSTSLIRGHLGARKIRLRSTCCPSHPLGFVGLHADTGLFRPYFNDSPRDEQIEFDTWWEGESIMKLFRGNESVTRRQLVLTAANKDGGAHVDTETTGEYDRLQSGVGIEIEVGSLSGERWMVDFRLANLAGLRQIGHEILTSDELIGLLEKPEHTAS